MLVVVWKEEKDWLLDDAGPWVQGEAVDGFEGDVIDPEGTEVVRAVED